MTAFVEPVDADDIARAWLDTIVAVAAQPEQRAFHVVTRMRAAERDGESRIHAAASELLADADLQPLNTVANTVFPAAMAQQTRDIEALTARYEDVYPQLRKYQKNKFGTYFHRLVAYPGQSGPVNQIARVITNLNSELAGDRPMRARYEANLETPGDADSQGEGVSGGAAAVPVYAADRDTRRLGFPCLSFLSFQHDTTHLHAVAHYRSQYLLERGLGNYLGIARLLRYIAEHTGLGVGALTVVAGYAAADHLKKSDIADLEDLRDGLAAAPATSALSAQPATGQSGRGR
jgi:hypothetical protein